MIENKRVRKTKGYFKLFLSFFVLTVGFFLFYLCEKYGLLTLIPGAILGGIGLYTAWYNIPLAELDTKSKAVSNSKKIECIVEEKKD
ncbi:hypothetical protein [Aliikangiella maris]|uniref:Uncharacterized protein n=2 Tax=Aliikangiella maris TaxID=3162458 RepID=A0ABV2BYS9_9GAMM